VLAKPPVRKLAKDLGVDLATVTPTGPKGTVSRADVEAASPAPRPARVAAEGDERIPIKGVRKATAENMVASAFTAPHVTVFLTCDVTAMMETVAALKGRKEFADVKVTPLLLVAKAVLLACKRHPMINAQWDAEAGEIVVKRDVNLGIAAATPRGLMVPNIKAAQELSLVELAGAIGDLVRTARDGKTQPADMANGTFSITNVGVFGVDTGTPILPPGESAILVFGAVRPQPWVHEGEIAVRQVTTLGLSFDHRLIDGELGSQFLADVGAFLADPGGALLAWT
jgi:pyruvate dehydrogenase E2 component (dihydrolipoamide acetyltransferase)